MNEIDIDDTVLLLGGDSLKMMRMLNPNFAVEFKTSVERGVSLESRSPQR